MSDNTGSGKRETGNVDRRAFLGFAGAGLASLTPLAHHVSRFPFPVSHLPLLPSRISSIGLQLYTVRDLMKTDFNGTLAHVAAVGYKEVEFAGYFDQSPGQVRRALVTHGLVSPSAHLPFESIAKGWEQVLDASHVIGHHYVTVAWIPEEARKDIDGWKRVGETLTKAGAACKAAGMELCYHNHSYEFVPLEGQLPYDVVLASSDPELVKAEMDLYWITDGGKDPLTYFARYPGRFPQVHVKDMAAGPGPDHQMVDVGQGIIDWKKIFAHSEQAGIKHYYVEHDNPPDALNDIKVSYEYLKALRF